MRDFVIIVAVAFGAAVAVRIARWFALKRALLDVPNERSSHRQPVPRLGGAAFMPIVLLAAAFGWSGLGLPFLLRIAFFSGAAALFGISLLDDFRPLPTVVRFLVQFAAAGALVAAVGGSLAGGTVESLGLGLPAVGPEKAGPLIISSLLTVGIVGLVNIYNFMDGIDGIAGVQAVAAGAAWWAIAGLVGAPQAGLLAACIAAGALGFLTLNWPPAKIFMGDAGSTVLGYSFAVLPLLVWVETKGATDLWRLIVVGLLVVWPFLADGTFTILRRLRKRENIFKAHRSHLYQRLVIAGKSHQCVTLVYGALAVVGAFLGLWVIKGHTYSYAGSAAIVALLFGSLWRWTVACEKRAALRRAGTETDDRGLTTNGH